MGVKTTPAVYTFTCDRCGVYENSETNTRPKYWCDLTFEKHAYDWSGAAVADASQRFLICQECTNAVLHKVGEIRLAKSEEKPDGA